ncbi:MAG: hypothetical protein RRY55_04460 [Bacteroidales bacterium]
MRHFIYVAVFIVILPSCCLRSRTIKGTSVNDMTFSYKSAREDSLRSFASMFISDSVFTEIDIRECAISTAGDTISPIRSKKIIVKSMRKSTNKAESESFIKGRSFIDGKENCSAVYENNSSSSFLRGLRFLSIILISICVIIILLYVIKKRKG